MNKKIKVSLGTFGVITAIITPVVTVVSCNDAKKQNLLDSTNKNKQTTNWEKLEKLHSITRKPLQQPYGDHDLIQKIQKWQKEKNKNGFNASAAWVKNSNSPFNRSPRTIMNGENIDKDGTKWNTNNIPAKILGMEGIKKYIKKIDPNNKVKISLIEGTKDDATGTLYVKLTINEGKKSETSFEFKISGFTQTADIELKGQEYKSIIGVIEALDKAKIVNASPKAKPIHRNVNLGFEKHISIMLPKDLKQELIDLYHSTNGGRLTVIGTYKNPNGKIYKSAIALDRHKMLKELINAFGDVENTKRYAGGFEGFVIKKIHNGIPGGFGKILSDYKDILSKDKVEWLAGLLGNIDDKVFNMFPRLITLFDNVANGVKNMEMITKWSKDRGIAEKDIEKLNVSLVTFVLNSGKKLDKSKKSITHK